MDKILQGASPFFFITHSKKKSEIRVTLYSKVMLMYLQSRKKGEKKPFKIIIATNACWDSQARICIVE